MKTPEENRPVLVGVAQLALRDTDPATAPGPLEMLTRMAREAADDAGAGKAALTGLDAIGVVDVAAWGAKNAPRMLAEAVGARPARETLSGLGGETPVALLNDLASNIAAGRSRIALLAGSNNLRTLRKAHKAGIALDWKTEAATPGEPDAFRETRKGASPLERHYGLQQPTEIYPIFENALRARRKLSLEEHRARMGALFHPFTKVAAANPYAWFPVERSAEVLATATPQNRMVGFPYTKYLNAVLDTDQAAAVLLVSAGAARELGIPEERWVYWRGGADAIEQAWWASERPDHGECPALKASQGTALARAGLSIDDMDRFDLYSCFPAAVGMACEMLDLAIDDPRGLTVTGGLPYFGGPANNYTTHSLAQMAIELREGRGTNGLVTGNGWYLTKHSATVLSTTPSESDLEPAGAAPLPQDMRTDPVPVAEEASGRGTVETYTVLYGRDGAPERGIVIGRLDDGTRFLANTPEDRDLLEAFAAEEAIGRRGQVRRDEDRNLFDPR
jgi:acetyl-CoA C-acetyltransferase